MEWVNIKNQLPESRKMVLCLTDKFQFVGFYTKGHDVDYEDYDYEGEYDPVEEKAGCLFLKPGFYEECEQHNGEYDVVYLNRGVTHWMTLPDPPKDI